MFRINKQGGNTSDRPIKKYYFEVVPLTIFLLDSAAKACKYSLLQLILNTQWADNTMQNHQKKPLNCVIMNNDGVYKFQTDSYLFWKSRFKIKNFKNISHSMIITSAHTCVYQNKRAFLHNYYNIRHIAIIKLLAKTIKIRSLCYKSTQYFFQEHWSILFLPQLIKLRPQNFSGFP